MCGIVGAVAQRDVAPILLEGLKRLEYRGYDSAGIAVIDTKNTIQRHRALGKVKELQEILVHEPLLGTAGLAHTRWATHGKPSENNAHPLMSGNGIALVHNGIIENHEILRKQLLAKGYEFNSETDTEIVGHLLHSHLDDGKTFLASVQATVAQLEGAYAIGFMYSAEPHHIIVVRSGSPLVIGLGIGENFIASDHLALLPVSHRFIYLKEGDIADIYRNKVQVYDENGDQVHRETHISDVNYDIADRGKYRHFMMKEIFEQATAVSATLEGRTTRHHVLDEAFGSNASKLFDRVKHIQIAACGTSYHAGMVARYWLEEIAGIPCQVEPASEIRYRHNVVQADTLFVTLSQSGETADTLAALRAAKNQNYLGTLAICNAPESSLVREADLCLLTHAGPEIGVASTKGFTTQLVALLLLTIALGKRGRLTAASEENLIAQLRSLPKKIEHTLELNKTIQILAEHFANKHHALFIGRGPHFPIALEGALKLKEISYIHAEAYPAGELKHGPLALIDKEMPVVAIIPNDDLLEKMKSSIHEVRARGADLVIFTDPNTEIEINEGENIIILPAVEKMTAPLVYTIALQLLAYHVAVLKGTDVDQPRNLAKSVTVE